MVFEEVVLFGGLDILFVGLVGAVVEYVVEYIVEDLFEIVAGAEVIT